MRCEHIVGVAVLSVLLLAGGSPLQAQDEGKPVATKAAGSIVGRTILTGKVFRNKPIDMKCDPVCAAVNAGRPAYTQRVLVDKKGNLANVVVWINNVPKGDYPAKRGRVILDQVACRYVPHVLVIQLGQELRIRNSDGACHNVHFKSKLNGDWNVTQATKGTIHPREELKKPEVGTALFKCDIHPWMECRVAVFDHPFFAVSHRDGTFEIPTHNLPAGKYEVWAWHEKYKRLKLKDVDLQPGKRVPLTLTYE